MRLADLAELLRLMPQRSLARHLKAILAAEIVVVYLHVRWLMRRQDIRTIVSTIHSSPSPVAAYLGALEAREVAVRLGVAVRRTLSWLPTDSRCLVQSLVLSRLLSARAISSTLVIGARPEPRFDAHAWIEHDGLPVLPQQDFGELRLVEI